MNPTVQPADLAFFSALVRAGSLSAAGRELGVTTAAVSKRLAAMEGRAGAALVQRTTRRMSLTSEGALCLEHARRVLGEIEALQAALGGARTAPAGLLRVNATLGFGRSHVAPLLSRFVRQHPAVQAQLRLSVDPPPLSEDAFDVCIRFGAPPDLRVLSRRLAPNRRLMCAAPAYLKRHGTPEQPQDLSRHNCIGIRQGEEAYGVWRLSPVDQPKTARAESVRIRGNLTTNDGEIAVQWALEGHGILMRAEWDIARYLKSGRLVQVLPQYATPDADIHAVWPQSLRSATRVRAFVDFLETALGRRAQESSGSESRL